MSVDSEAFRNAVVHVLDVEGGFSDHQADSGGATHYGITEALAREHDYTGPMRDLPQATALQIYHDHFWAWMHLDEVHAIAPPVACELFDAGVNVGRRRVWRWLQRSLNALNRRERDYDDIAVDGWPGDQSLRALRGYIEDRPEGGPVLASLLNALQARHYLTLVEARPKDEAFMYGWVKQRVLQEP